MDLKNDDGTIPILGKKPRLCNICGKNYHPFDVRCVYGNLVERIRQLLHANAAIPGILATNKEVTELANTYQKLAKDTAMALVICEKTVMEFENGTQIWKRFQEKLAEAGWQKISLPDTDVPPAVSNPESTIPNETESKQCTGEIQPGETTAPDSSPSTDAATPVESPQQ